MRAAVCVMFAVALLLLVLLPAARGHAGHSHSHDHHHDDHEHEHVHEHEHDHHEHSRDTHTHDGTSQGGLWARFTWIAEWLLVALIAVLVLKIASVIFWPAKARAAAPYKPKRKPMKLFLTLAELRQYDGSDPKLPVLVGIRGVLYDVSSRRDLYGTKGQGYNILAGHDASYALATHQLDPAAVEVTKLDDLTPGQVEALSDWEASYKGKYDVAGEIVASEDAKQQKTAAERKRYDAETEQLAREESAKSK